MKWNWIVCTRIPGGRFFGTCVSQIFSSSDALQYNSYYSSSQIKWPGLRALVQLKKLMLCRTFASSNGLNDGHINLRAITVLFLSYYYLSIPNLQCWSEATENSSEEILNRPLKSLGEKHPILGNNTMNNVQICRRVQQLKWHDSTIILAIECLLIQLLLLLRHP